MSVFISYSSKDLSFAQQMVNAIRANGIDVWFSQDSIKTGETYSEAIVKGIKNSDSVLMLLSQHSLKSKHVQIELTLALDKNVKIYPVRLEDILPDAKMEYYFITSQWYDLFYESFADALNTFVNKTFPKNNNTILETTQKTFLPDSPSVESSTPSTSILDTAIDIKRYKNTYDVTEKREKQRIKMRRSLTLQEDINVIKNIIKEDKKIYILDIGCNTGEHLISRLEALGCLKNVQALVGIDINESIIEDAKAKAISENFHYVQLDVESNDFLDDLKDIMGKNDIEKFDFITATMVLMHLKKAYKLLRSIRKVLSSDGNIFIRDMDDTLSMAYPDEDNLVGKMLDISSRLPTTGYRENGRQIYSFLKKSGYSSIQMHPESINTIGRSHDDRETLFRINFGFVQGDLELAKDEFSKEHKWMEDSFDELEELFQRDDFFYQMGTIVYTASK